MGSIKRNLKTFSGALLGIVILLVALFFLLNFAAQRGWGPFSSGAAWVAAHANGSAYSSAGTLVGVPSTPVMGMGPHL